MYAESESNVNTFKGYFLLHNTSQYNYKFEILQLPMLVVDFFLA
jgi:hypothetical protein